MATTTAISIYRGESVLLEFVVDPVTDITGWTLQFTLARQKNSSNKLIEKACVITVAVDGTFSATLSSTETDISPGKYWWDVWRIDSGSKRVLGIGSFTVLPDVYRPE